MVKNILSYQPGAHFTGKECKDFFKALYQKDERGKKIATKYLNHFEFKDEHMYETYRGHMQEGKPECLMFKRVDKEK